MRFHLTRPLAANGFSGKGGIGGTGGGRPGNPTVGSGSPGGRKPGIGGGGKPDKMKVKYITHNVPRQYSLKV